MQAFDSGGEIMARGRRTLFGETSRAGVAVYYILKEVRWRHFQRTRDVLEPAGADSIGPLFVLLDLLEGYTEGIAKFFLTHAEQYAASAHTGAHMVIHWVWVFSCHGCFLLCYKPDLHG